MEVGKLTVSLRDQSGKGGARKLRAEGKVPGVCYGASVDGRIEPLPITVDVKQLRGALDPVRKRKLLLHKREIRKLIGKTVEKGMTLVPTRMYLKEGRIKVAIGLAKGKKEHDKRETIKRREADRETRAAVKERRSR